MTINIGTPGVAATGAQIAQIKADLGIYADGLPLALTGSTGLTAAAHANRRLEVSSPSPVNIDMPASPATGDRYFGVNLGAGAITLRTSAGGGLTGDASLPTTVTQYSPFEVWFTAGGYVRVA